MEELNGYHIVLTTHNSRYSNRMKKYNVIKGPPRLLSPYEELILTRIISDIMKESNYKCIAYNVCKDHVHMIMVCSAKNLSKCMQKLKSVSSKLFHRHPRINPSLTRLQKFFRVNVDPNGFAQISSRSGRIYKASHLANAIHYIKHNRKKHNLPEIEGLQEVIEDFTMSTEEAYGLFNGP